MSRAVILSAPQAWGKTRNAATLRDEYRCSRVVDDWEPGMVVKPGALHLTNVPVVHIREDLEARNLVWVTIISRGWFMRRQAGGVLVQVALALAFFTLTLGWLGPTLDAEPYPVPEPTLEPGTVARLEAEARQHCDRAAGRNSGWIELADGQIACTTKRGKRLNSTITVLHRSER